MKRIGSIICLAVLMFAMTAGSALAADFSIEETFPHDGAKNTTKENMCVKVMFNQDVGNKASKKANKGLVKITRKDGKEIPTLVYYNKKDPKYALIHIDTTKVPQTGKNAIKDNTEYICTIDGDFQDNNGNKLGEETKISFTTQDQGKGMMVYMILMMVIMGGMVFVMVMQSKKQMEEQTNSPQEEGPFNPYKEAKRTGKSVEQVIAEHEKKSKKKEVSADYKVVEEDPYRDGEYYRVKRPRPISEAGSTYKTGRKAKAEAAKKKAEAEKAKRKAQGYKKKKK